MNMNDIYSIHGYAQIMYQMKQPNAKVQIDRHGHALIEYPGEELIEEERSSPSDCFVYF